MMGEKHPRCCRFITQTRSHSWGPVCCSGLVSCRASEWGQVTVTEVRPDAPVSPCHGVSPSWSPTRLFRFWVLTPIAAGWNDGASPDRVPLQQVLRGQFISGTMHWASVCWILWRAWEQKMKMTWSLLWRELLSQAGQTHRETLSAGTAVGERGGVGVGVGLGMGASPPWGDASEGWDLRMSEKRQPRRPPGPESLSSMETNWAKAWKCRQHKGTKSNEVKQRASVGFEAKGHRHWGLAEVTEGW